MMKVRKGNRKEGHLMAFLANGMIAFMAIGSISAAYAFEFTPGPDLEAHWDNSIKYSTALRLSNPSTALLANINGDDGNRNFRKGLLSSRLDILSEFDLTYKKQFGVRLSGAAWYDALYNRSNHNDSPSTVNYSSSAYNEFPTATRQLHGRKAEILDAFLFANEHVNDMPVNVRIGKHTVLWGESLLLATNGISYAQAPLDLIKAQAVPGSQAKELFMPVGQISGQVIPKPNLSFAGYYQYQWRETRLPAAGSYFSTADILDAGGERLLFAPNPGPALVRSSPDGKASNHGQWGISARYRAESTDTEFGVYYLQFHEKLPQAYLQPTIGDYFLVYPGNIKLIGASFSTSVGKASIGGEIHVRHNTPLASAPLFASNSDRNTSLYAIGDTLHGQLSAIYALSSSPLWQGGSVLAEIGAVRRMHIEKNTTAIDPESGASAWGLSVKFSPSYYQVLPNLDINIPLSVTYNPRGKSPMVAVFKGDKAGTFSIGLEAEYLKQWHATLLLTSYIGSQDVQPLSDRDFVSFSLQRTF